MQITVKCCKGKIMTILDNIKNVYFIGIGGIGMSALARYFKIKGYNVAGYDKTKTDLTEKMAKNEGFYINYVDNIESIPEEYRQADNTLVVYTPAIPSDNEQLNYFIKKGIHPHKRSEVLGLLSQSGKALCVAGTHGKRQHQHCWLGCYITLKLSAVHF